MWRVWLRKAWRSLSRLRFGIILLACLLGAVSLSTLMPQLPQGADSTAWWAAVRDRYGLFFGPLRALGLFNLSDALWLKGLLGLLLLSTLACLLNRVWPLGKVVFRPRTRIPAERFERAAIQAHLVFASIEDAESALREALRRRRYRAQLEWRENVLDPKQRERYMRADRFRLPRLGTLLTHVGLALLLLGAAWGGVRGWRTPALTVESDQITRVGNGTGVGLRCDQFTVVRHADASARDYRARLTLVAENGAVLKRGSLRVNHPLTYAGVSYYLQGFHIPAPSEGAREASAACHVVVSALHDPGYGLVVTAGFVLLVGVTLTFHFPHRRLWARIKATGETSLVGSTAWDEARFRRQFDDLVAELAEAEA